MLRRFSPSESLATVEEVNLAALRGSGKRLILLDVDNTLLPWRGDDIPSTVHEWLSEGKSLGLEFCILSNTRHPERLIGLSERLGVPYIRSKFKPSRRMYLMALEKHGCKPEEAVMVGDQLLTDVLGANRSGIDAIWIRPVGKREFIGTRLVSRNIERLVGRFLFKYFQVADGEMERAGPTGLFSHKIVRQFLKFCLVGGLSTVVDLGLHYLLMFKLSIGGVVLSERVPLLGGTAVPFHSFRVVLRHALAVGVHDSQVKLGVHVPLLGSKAKPFHRFSAVLRHASAVPMHDTQVLLGSRVTLLGSKAKPLHRFSFVPYHAFAVGVPETQAQLGARVALLGSVFEILDIVLNLRSIGRLFGIIQPLLQLVPRLRLPLAGKALGFGDLLGGHLLDEGVSGRREGVSPDRD